MADQRPVTLAAIARRAGVHVSTVSRALSDDPSGVAKPNIERIRALAEELGYRRDTAATALRTGRSSLIGMLVPFVTDYVLARIFEGVDHQARLGGYDTVVTSTYDEPASRLAKLEHLLARRAEGIVIGDARLDGDDVVQMLRRRRVPYVLVNRRIRGHPSVTLDDVAGGRMAAEHLLDFGHEKVGVIAGPSYASTCVERTHGFVGRFRTAGIEVPFDCVRTSMADVDGGHEAAAEILEADTDVTAIFAINDFAAIGAMGAVTESGRLVGRDVAIIGYNDIPAVRYLPVPLTSVASPMTRMGEAGSALLQKIIDGGEGEEELIQPTLSVRASTHRVNDA